MTMPVMIITASKTDNTGRGAAAVVVAASAGEVGMSVMTCPKK
jgi:hypothetical protein